MTDKGQNVNLAEDRKQTVATLCNKLLEENDENLKYLSDTYAQGYHDALLDVLQGIGVPTERKHFD